MSINLFNKYKISLISILMLLISLSCDDQTPVDAQAPTLDYTIIIQSEVQNPLEVGQIIMCFGDDGCSELNGNECESEEELDCIWGEPTNVAYSAGAKNIEDIEVLTDRGYHLFFEFKLRDIDGEPVEGASLVAIEDYLGEDTQQGQFTVFQDNDMTNSSGIINGYWEDNGQSGDFMITIKYTDENEDIYSIQYPITILPTIDVVSEVTIELESSQIFILDEGQGTTTVYAYDENLTNKQLENY